jgi:hypothetical protein
MILAALSLIALLTVSLIANVALLARDLSVEKRARESSGRHQTVSV